LVAWFVAEMGSFGKLFVQFVLTVVAAAILWACGEGAADWMLRFRRAPRRRARRSGDPRLAGQAIRSVARGVIVTAGADGRRRHRLVDRGDPFRLGSHRAHVPPRGGPDRRRAGARRPGDLAVLERSPGMGTFLLVVTVIAATLDNFLRRSSSNRARLTSRSCSSSSA
jgi:hypothetical protein